jgi:hypothetical protein
MGKCNLCLPRLEQGLKTSTVADAKMMIIRHS